MKRVKFAPVNLWEKANSIKRDIFECTGQNCECAGASELKLSEEQIISLHEIGKYAATVSIEDAVLPEFALSLCCEDIPYELDDVLSPDNFLNDTELDICGMEVLFLKDTKNKGNLLCSFGVHYILNGSGAYSHIATFDIVSDSNPDGDYYFILPVGAIDNHFYCEISLAKITEYLTYLWSGVQKQFEMEAE